MNLIFQLDNVISTPAKGIAFGLVDNIKHTKPIEDVVEFMQWAHKEHHITIWCERNNELQTKMVTEEWLEINNVTYDRLLFDRPRYPIFVDETPPNTKYRGQIGDNSTIAMLFEEWKEWYRSENTEK